MSQFLPENGWLVVAETIYEDVVRNPQTRAPIEFSCGTCRGLANYLGSRTEGLNSKVKCASWLRDSSRRYRRWRCKFNNNCSLSNQKFVQLAVKRLSPALLKPVFDHCIDDLETIVVEGGFVDEDLLELIDSVTTVKGRLRATLDASRRRRNPSPSTIFKSFIPSSPSSDVTIRPRGRVATEIPTSNPSSPRAPAWRVDEAESPPVRSFDGAEPGPLDWSGEEEEEGRVREESGSEREISPHRRYRRNTPPREISTKSASAPQAEHYVAVRRRRPIFSSSNDDFSDYSGRNASPGTEPRASKPIQQAPGQQPALGGVYCCRCYVQLTGNTGSISSTSSFPKNRRDKKRQRRRRRGKAEDGTPAA